MLQLRNVPRTIHEGDVRGTGLIERRDTVNAARQIAIGGRRTCDEVANLLKRHGRCHRVENRIAHSRRAADLFPKCTDGPEDRAVAQARLLSAYQKRVPPLKRKACVWS